ncbi:Putative zn(2)Cys(6) fungal-type DNA-binding domain-containing protein [Colletotrichum destructivum]|uniref:Zn(2)Cys(6) fungal-type DNA-binding domain-containing protein n=1 Tax=Colletotrichum destructivum TaxID=34406 RepID=A0AAX4IF03_9PEZI|nr:Putative zn(2)Cys(6) fungal-type DNA-binding domain-containing protein [Colletotrichum destructivum]
MDNMGNEFGLTEPEMEAMTQIPFSMEFTVPNTGYDDSSLYLGFGSPVDGSSYVPGMRFYQQEQEQEQYVDPRALEQHEPAFWNPDFEGKTFQQPEVAIFSHEQGLEEAAFSHAQGPEGPMTIEQAISHYLPLADDLRAEQTPVFVADQSQEPEYYVVDPKDNVEEGTGEASGAARNDVEEVFEKVVEQVIEEEVPREASAAALTDRVLAPKTKGNRVAKKARKTPLRTVKANSCERCRSSKTKCVREDGAASCGSCLKKGFLCHVLGTDGRTNKTNKDRLEAASLAVEEFFRDGILLCNDVAQRRLADFGDEKVTFIGPMVRSTSDYQSIRNGLSGQIGQQPTVEFGASLFRPLINYHDAKLSETRTVHLPKLKQLALDQGEILAGLINMVVFGSRYHVTAGAELISQLLYYKSDLGSFQARVQKYFPAPGEPRDVFEQVRQGIEQRIQKALE